MNVKLSAGEAATIIAALEHWRKILDEVPEEYDLAKVNGSMPLDKEEVEILAASVELAASIERLTDAEKLIDAEKLTNGALIQSIIEPPGEFTEHIKLTWERSDGFVRSSLHVVAENFLAAARIFGAGTAAASSADIRESLFRPYPAEKPGQVL